MPFFCIPYFPCLCYGNLRGYFGPSCHGHGKGCVRCEIRGSIAVDGFISSLSSLFGCLPITSFSQNVGLVAMTHVVNRKAIASGALIMILAGLFPALELSWPPFLTLFLVDVLL